MNEAKKSKAPWPVEHAMAALADILQSKPIDLFKRVGGDVEFVILEPERTTHWTISATHGEVAVLAQKCAAPVLRFGFNSHALTWLLRGTLDIARALESKHMAIEGDLEKLRAWAECFAVAKSPLSVRYGGG